VYLEIFYNDMISLVTREKNTNFSCNQLMLQWSQD